MLVSHFPALSLSAKVRSHSIIPQAASLCMADSTLGKRVECQQLHPSTHYQTEQAVWAGDGQLWPCHQYLRWKLLPQNMERKEKEDQESHSRAQKVRAG